MKYIYCIALLFMTVSAMAQDTVFVHTYGGVADDVCRRIIPTDSGYYFIGTTASSGRGPTDVYIVQTDRGFNFVRSKTIGAWDVDFMTDVQVMEDKMVIVGSSNTETFGEYTGKVWVVDSTLALVAQTSIDYGQTTFPHKVLVRGETIYVAGSFTDNTDQYFLSGFSPQLQQQFKRTFNADEIGRIDSWIWNDGQLVVANVAFDAGDSIGQVSKIDSQGLVISHLELPDSIGIARKIRVLKDSNYLFVGDKVDTAGGDSNRVMAIAKYDKNLTGMIWDTMLEFPGWYAYGVDAIELSNKCLAAVAVTNYQFSDGGLGVVVTEFDSNGVLQFGNGSIYGWVGDDVIYDALLLQDDTVVAVGYTDSYGAGVKDFYALLLPVRSQNYEYDLDHFIDTSTKVLSVPEIKNRNVEPHCLELAVQGSSYSPLECVQGVIEVFDLRGAHLFSFDSTQEVDLGFLGPGYLILGTENERVRIFIPHR